MTISETIVEISGNQATIVVETSPVVKFAGGNDANFSQGFSGDTTSLIITHNLGKYPAVTVIEGFSGEEVDFDVEYLNTNQIQLSWIGTFSGTVQCN